LASVVLSSQHLPAMRQDPRRFQRVVHHPVGRWLD
jgi:hypothetical protein